jgi:glycosyltransferase-like protein
MRSVGMFTYSTRPRGSVVHAAGLAEALAGRGHDVTLYALAKPGASFFRPIRCRVELIAAGEAPADRARLVGQRVGEFIDGLRSRDLEHDVFHAQDCLAASALLGLGLRPVVRTVHHVDRFEDPYLANCQRRSVLEADVVLSVSRFTQKQVFAEFNRRTAVVRNGVDASRFARPVASEGRSILADFGVGPDDIVILSVGGVEPRKNTRRCLAAVARLYAKCPRISWVIVGGDSIWDHSEYAARFDADVAALPAALALRIVRPGPVGDDDLTELYRESDILLGPSLLEGFGLAVLEAMAAGTCVVVPGREPFTEYLDRRSAAFVDPESVDSIADTLVDLVLDPGRRADLQRSAARRAARFTWERCALSHSLPYEAAWAACRRGAVRETQGQGDA